MQQKQSLPFHFKAHRGTRISLMLMVIQSYANKPPERIASQDTCDFQPPVLPLPFYQQLNSSWDAITDKTSKRHFESLEHQETVLRLTYNRKGAQGLRWQGLTEFS